MTFIDAIDTCLSKKYATFSGRATRSEYWWFGLFVAISVFVAALIGGTIANGGGMVIMYLIAFAALIVPSLAVLVRRLHDIGKSGWWALINLVPYVGGIILFIFTLLESAPDNEYGSKQ